MMTGRRRIIATVICAVIMLFMFVASAYIVHEAVHHHDCTGEDCPICRFIAQIEQMRRGFGAVALTLLLICSVQATAREWRFCATGAAPAIGTLVGRKIRLND